MVLNCIILGDDPDGFEELEKFLAATPLVYLVCRCASMRDARHYLETKTIHIVILGNNIKEMNNLPLPPEFQSVLPVMVITYPDHKNIPYDLHPAGLMQQPFTQTVFNELINKIYNIIDMEGIATPAKNAGDYFMIRSENRQEKIFYKDLQYVEVMDDHILLHLGDQKIVTTEKLDWILAQLPVNAFMRVHRWFVIGFRHITHLGDDHVLVGKAKIPLTSQVQTEVAKRYQLPW
ncbi:DNA-binding LytR/AlgR family response regulator [Chitinophaga niastensis]|uniref:DNA-binding LytR/AlgR family response regulator n=1 Tax=Chitinophaga niastensis TaxID=536980 RepID=A0A2P8HM04_CHINA|nr:LytTR family transcriptional regulator DNA-binding domain-containing protein [Chitinophaga niastensis]PSL47229.1 DNA-binding LytR/AlgR family response regulator [Chitinophaga niastensis]